MYKYIAAACAGFITGVLLAPEKGSRTRRRIGRQAHGLTGRIREWKEGKRPDVADLQNYLTRDIDGLSPTVRSRMLTILQEAVEMAYDPEIRNPDVREEQSDK